MSEQKQLDDSEGFLAVLEENYAAMKRFAKSRLFGISKIQNDTLQQEYEDLISIYKNGNWQSKQDGLLRWVELVEVAKEIDQYLCEEKYSNGKPIHLNSIGSFSILHKKLITALNELEKMPQGVNDERSVANVDAQSGEDWKQEFTYFLEHLITNEKEKINLIVAEVERIAGSKKEEQL